MSALMCTDNHLAYLVLAYRKFYARPGSGVSILTHEANEIARLLKYENARSVAHRYPSDELAKNACPACGKPVCNPRIGWEPARTGERDIPEPCVFAKVAIPLNGERIAADMTPVMAIKAVQFYQYQASEHREWEGSRAMDFTDAIMHSAIRALPGYEEAPWGIP